MAQESQIPQQLMTAALLHFESGVPIVDCRLDKRGYRDRMARVHHVYYQWLKNPYLNTFELFKQMSKGTGADRSSEWRIAQRDEELLRFVKEHIALSSRQQDEAMVRAAANQAIRIGLETDNVNALTKGGKLLYEVAGLDKPEDSRDDMSKVAFLPPVVVTNIKEVDDTKENVDDEEAKRIIAKYGGYVDEKRKMIDDKVAIIESRKDEQDWNEPEREQ